MDFSHKFVEEQQRTERRMAFPYESEDVLIAAVRKRPVLFDKRHPDYSKRQVSGKQWSQVGNEVGIEAGLCKLKWQSLRDYYMRKRREADVLSSPGVFVSARKKKWHLFDSLSFLDCLTESGSRVVSSCSLDMAVSDLSDEPFVSIEEVQEDNPEDIKDDINIIHSPHSSASREEDEASPSPNKKSRTDCQDVNLEHELLKFLSRNECSEHEHWFRSLIPALDKLSITQTLTFRSEVHGLLVKYLQEQDDVTNNSSKSTSLTKCPQKTNPGSGSLGSMPSSSNASKKSTHFL